MYTHCRVQNECFVCVFLSFFTKVHIITAYYNYFYHHSVDHHRRQRQTASLRLDRRLVQSCLHCWSIPAILSNTFADFHCTGWVADLSWQPQNRTCPIKPHCIIPSSALVDHAPLSGMQYDKLPKLVVPGKTYFTLLVLSVNVKHFFPRHGGHW